MFSVHEVHTGLNLYTWFSREAFSFAEFNEDILSYYFIFTGILEPLKTDFLSTKRGRKGISTSCSLILDSFVLSRRYVSFHLRQHGCPHHNHQVPRRCLRIPDTQYLKESNKKRFEYASKTRVANYQQLGITCPLSRQNANSVVVSWHLKQVDKGNKEPLEKIYRIYFNFMGELSKELYSHYITLNFAKH